jgi:hypothetical protein
MLITSNLVLAETATRLRDDAGLQAALAGVPGALTRGLNESGWLADEVIAAGVLRQGKAPSVLGAVTGLVLIELARRRSKSLPREFVLAATAERAVAFATSAEGRRERRRSSRSNAASLAPGLASWCGCSTKGLFMRGAILGARRRGAVPGHVRRR